MALSNDNLVTLIGHLAWPVTVIIGCIFFYDPLVKLIETLGKRITKLSAFKIDIELAKLSEARSLGATVESLRKTVVSESGMAPIVADVAKSGAADYLIVNIGNDGDKWLTSRLFLLAAILERSSTVRCLVFLDGDGHLVGVATIKNVRRWLGAHYLQYEAAFSSAHCGVSLPAGMLPDPNVFRGGLNEKLINSLSASFLQNNLISKPWIAANPETGWVELKRQFGPDTLEFANWVTASSLKDILGLDLLTGSVVADIGRVSPEVAKSIVRLSGPFVALISQDNVFKEICDRYAVLESVAREAIEQSAAAG
jgi:hypothetical protein